MTEMNLIEQLGGYEKANEELKIRISKGFVYSVIELEEALLEYRRQHNIFEVGDLVTHLTTRDILKVISIEDSNKHYRFIKVKAINPENQESVNEFNSLWFQLKHATDAEIKAGKRLEVNQ